MSTVKVLCSASKCRWKNDTGYYSICKHPTNMGKVSYDGINRYYTGGCECSKCEVDKCELGECKCQ